MNKTKKPNQLINSDERKINDKEISAMASKVQMRLFFSPIAILSLIVPFSLANVALAQTTTYVTCYFSNGNQRTWQWGLNPASNWYVLNGRWDRSHGGITRFVTNTSKHEIIESCRKSQQYYNLNGYRIEGIYAANSSAGSNYEIVARD
ncbi:hypothetical protein A0J48_008925 [Sphaerospermopsis aphanizomenoides BCCUSP55]|nr:hypothetical protein [Sphaerospermopsis aphanizomenoides BCCUSP55]